MPSKQNLPIVLLLSTFVVLALIYAWATPPFEASDELWHFGMVDSIARTGTLPVQVISVPKVKTVWEQEGSQPPLYYLLSAALVAPIDRSDIDTLRQPNPHAKAGIPGDSDNKNLVLHDSPHPPLQKTALAVYVVRLFSIALGTISIYAVYAGTRLIASEGVALLAAGLTAFNPMFLFITASVNNDNLVIALNSVLIWQMLVMLRDGFSFRRSLLLAILLALTSLSKLSGLVLIPVVGLAGLWLVYKQRNWRGWFTLIAMIVVAWLVIAGWWYVRNLTLYGELFGTRTMVAVAGPRLEPFTFGTLLSEFEGFRVSYWGLFGAVNILSPEAFYVAMDIITVIALVGLALHLWRRRSDHEHLVRIGLLALIIMIGMIAVIGWTAQTYASQGRLLFPYVAAISSLLAIGLVELVRIVYLTLNPSPPSGEGLTKQRRFPLATGGWGVRYANLSSPQMLAERGSGGEVNLPSLIPIILFGIFALIIPFAIIAPAYTPPPPQTAIPDSANKVYARFGDFNLIGYSTSDQRYGSGQSVPITLYWQVINRSSRDLSLYLHAVDARGNVIGRVDTYPGAGRLQTTTWEPGAIYADSYEVPLGAVKERSNLRIQVGWWDYPTQVLVEPVDNNGQKLDSVMLTAGAYAGGDSVPLPTDITRVDSVNFGGVIALQGYHLADNQLTLEWQATGTLSADYTVFVQLLDSANAIVGQGDAPPSFPTHYWKSGDQVETQHTLTYAKPLSTGSYHIVIGWYKPSDFSRLSIKYPDSAYPLTTITAP